MSKRYQYYYVLRLSVKLHWLHHVHPVSKSLPQKEGRRHSGRAAYSMKLHTQQAHFSSQNYWGSKEEIYFMQKPYQQNSGMTWVSIPWTVGLPKWEGRSSYEKFTFLGNARISVLSPASLWATTYIFHFLIFHFNWVNIGKRHYRARHWLLWVKQQFKISHNVSSRHVTSFTSHKHSSHCN